MSKHDITVSILPPTLPNFLRVECRGGEPIMLPVERLSDKEAAEVWDAWKGAWMEHIAKRRLLSEGAR